MSDDELWRVVLVGGPLDGQTVHLPRVHFAHLIFPLPEAQGMDLHHYGPSTDSGPDGSAVIGLRYLGKVDPRFLGWNFVVDETDETERE